MDRVSVLSKAKLTVILTAFHGEMCVYSTLNMVKRLCSSFNGAEGQNVRCYFSLPLLPGGCHHPRSGQSFVTPRRHVTYPLRVLYLACYDNVSTIPRQNMLSFLGSYRYRPIRCIVEDRKVTNHEGVLQ